ncbi:MAG: hypothetical protein ABSA62_15850 [Methyloceanibacter sp.]
MRRDGGQGAVLIGGLFGVVPDHVIGVKYGAGPFNVSANVGVALQPFDAALQRPAHRLSLSRTGALLKRGDALIQFVDFNRFDVTGDERRKIARATAIVIAAIARTASPAPLRDGNAMLTGLIPSRC